jgi:polyphosphate glucokinase
LAAQLRCGGPITQHDERRRLRARASRCRAGLTVVKDTVSVENRPMPASKKKTSVAGAARRVLVIDVGGTHVKLRVDAHGKTWKFVSGPKMAPAHMVREIRKITRGTPFDAVSIGYPGLVLRGRIAAEPHNLGGRWVGFNFAKALGKPVRIVNDAAMQAIGSYSGGRMLFLGLGTGLGVALIIDGEVEATELGHLPYRHGRSYEDYVGERGRERRGNKKWRKSVIDVIAHLRAAFEADYVVLGGGNAARMKKLPHAVRLGDNKNAFTGGLRMWRRGG